MTLPRSGPLNPAARTCHTRSRRRDTSRFRRRRSHAPGQVSHIGHTGNCCEVTSRVPGPSQPRRQLGHPSGDRRVTPARSHGGRRAKGGNCRHSGIFPSRGGRGKRRPRQVARTRHPATADSRTIVRRTPVRTLTAGSGSIDPLTARFATNRRGPQIAGRLVPRLSRAAASAPALSALAAAAWSLAVASLAFC